MTVSQSQAPDWVELRRAKLQTLAELGLPYHPDRFDLTHGSEQIRAGFVDLEGHTVRVAGRIMANNLLGKAAFVRMQDTSGRIQVYVKKDVVGDRLWQYYTLLDHGDIIGVCGRVFKTRTGEITVEAQDITLLQKSFRPLPEKFHGLHDTEMRYRQRYLDLIVNQSSREVALARIRLTREIRRFLDDRGFIEVETPVLQPLYGGAAATPFVTHVDALDMTAYLRIADELYLKRLVVGGFERVYEIAKDFRNEGISRKHSPEFTMLELYQAFADYHDMMDLLEQMVEALSVALHGSADVRVGEQVIHLAGPWKRVTFTDAMQEHGGLDLRSNPPLPALREHARSRAVVVSEQMSRGHVLDQIWSTLVEPRLIQPTIVYDYPIDFPGSSLAKRHPRQPDLVQRFEAFTAGREIANAFSELNDPNDQLMRFDMLHGESEGGEGDDLDHDFLTALEYGMPPTGGMGVGIDRLTMVLTDTDQIRETILFPLLRPRERDRC